MALAPAFSVSAVQPSSFGYLPDREDAPYLDAHLSAYGVIATPGWSGQATLSAQVANDTLMFGYNPASTSDEADITDVAQLWRRSTVRCLMRGYNVTSDHQYLVVFEFMRFLVGVPQIQFFVGAEWVLSEPVDSTNETIALLLDCPGPEGLPLSVYARLASESEGQVVGLTGIQGYIV